jgi:hypothetical protein
MKSTAEFFELRELALRLGAEERHDQASKDWSLNRRPSLSKEMIGAIHHRGLGARCEIGVELPFFILDSHAPFLSNPTTMKGSPTATSASGQTINLS